jgi:Ca2+-binding EF-hand superfamily protein
VGVFAVTAAASTTAQPKPAAGAVAVPRNVFITTMDAEFKKMDADKNGILTKKEIEDFQRSTSILVAQRRNVALFQALDKDKNGQLSPAEFASLPMNIPPPNAAPILAATDGNRDGQVTLIEYRAGKLRNFDSMDADKDGIVTPAEMKAAGLIK